MQDDIILIVENDAFGWHFPVGPARADGLPLLGGGARVEIDRHGLAPDTVPQANHNALNHVVQAVALLLLSVGARGLSPGREGTRPC